MHPPKTNMSPKKGPFQKWSSSNHYFFSGDIRSFSGQYLEIFIKCTKYLEKIRMPIGSMYDIFTYIY